MGDLGDSPRRRAATDGDANRAALQSGQVLRLDSGLVAENEERRTPVIPLQAETAFLHQGDEPGPNVHA
jgi:hypothetical protein